MLTFDKSAIVFGDMKTCPLSNDNTCIFLGMEGIPPER
jgi:hypothetical protein